MIPQELKGQKAVPFLELLKSKLNVYGLLQETNEVFFDTRKYIDFYSQPFDVSMLVNPIELGKYSGSFKDTDTQETIAMMVGNEDIKLYPEWQQAEENVLFEGWEENFEEYDNGYICKTGQIWFRFKDNEFYYNKLGVEYATQIPKTLNDFITLCNLGGINLTFKK